MAKQYPPLEPDDVPDTRKKGEQWHKGLMISQKRAIAVASALFPDEIADGYDCMMGEAKSPCPFCWDKNQNWIKRVRQVRSAMIQCF